MQADKTIWLGQYPRLLLILSARLLPHISARRGFTGRIEVAAELRARRQLLFRPRLEPGDPVIPPAAELFFDAGLITPAICPLAPRTKRVSPRNRAVVR